MMFDESEVTNEADILFDLIVENALDFLDHSLDEVEDEPKYSVIHFYTAVELLLKARIVADDWKMIVSSNIKEPRLEDFQQGKLRTVGLNKIEEYFSEAFYRDKFKYFRKLSQHRNIMVHFFHPAISEADHQELLYSIKIEQLTAWYMLNKMLDLWDEYFYKWEEKLSAIDNKLSKIREYLSVVYNEQFQGIKQLKTKGATIKECPICRYESVVYGKVYDSFTIGTCLVCKYEDPILTINCPECDFLISFINEGRGECPQCGSCYEPEDLVSLFTKYISSERDYFESGLPAHCTHCGTCETVVVYEDMYLCLNCFTLFHEYDLAQCDFCGAKNAGKLENSYLIGCVVCDGSIGWNMAKDD